MLALQSLFDSYRSRSYTLMFNIFMLLVHVGVVKGNGSWIKGTREILFIAQKQGLRPPSLAFPAYELTLCIFCPSAIHGINLSWLWSSPQADVVLDLGLSPRLLYFIGTITQTAISDLDNSLAANRLQEQLEKLEQKVSGVDKGKEVTEQIAKSYLLSAHLLIDCRLLGLVLFPNSKLRH